MDLKEEFPIFGHHPGLIYLDNASTTQKPRAVIEAGQHFYEHQNANVHRGIYPLAAAATAVYEQTREKARAFLNAPKVANIVFTSGTTAGINLVAQSFLLDRLEMGDAVVISAMEHHANLIPWQQVCLRKKAKLIPIPMDPTGVLDLNVLQDILVRENVKILAITHISNTLGTINPIRDILAMAHAQQVPVLVDAAQSAACVGIDVQDLEVDFLVFSGHKMYGPTGTGILYGKETLLNAMPPWQFGGDMIREVTFERSLFAPIPHKFEAGTPNMAGVAALGAAIDFVQALGRDALGAHIKNLRAYTLASFQQLPGFQAIGTAPESSGILSFLLGDIHPHDLATLLGQQNICIRAGQHCTQPIMDFFDIPATARVSFAAYNTEKEVDQLKKALEKCISTMC